jgi:two-component system sensor histidine kinase UhpB
MLQEENVNAFVLNYHDITVRKKAEEDIQKSEKRFRSLIENAQDIISLSDSEGLRFYISPSIEKITGYTPEETINRPVFDIVHPDDIERTKKIRNELLKKPGTILPLTFRFIKKGGGIVWMEGTVVNMLHDENVKAVIGNYQDVTERKISEEKIRESNERFEMVSKATNDAVWDWNLATDKIYWNDEIRSMFDYCSEDIASGAEWKIHIHPEDFKRVIRKMVYHIKNKIQNWQDEYRFRCADGSYKYVFNRGFILFSEDGTPYRIIGAMQDVTEINKLQQSLNNERIKKQKELTNATIEGQEKERAQIGKELHDNVNQLLTGTKLYLDVASSQPSMKDEMIKRSSENLTICMEEIRRLSSALVPPSTGITSFEDIVQDLLEPIRLATDINILYDVKDVDGNVLTGEQQLNVYRIIQEHLNNIIKHSGAKNVRMNVKHINHVIEVEIKDDGKGFNVSARRKGIGFKNIQSRAELLNGKMEVISTPGNGCILLVSFPRDIPGNPVEGIY